MRHFHSNITPGVIHHQAQKVLQKNLDFQPFHQSVSVLDLIDLLLLMAAQTASLFATVTRYFGFSHQTATNALQANLPPEDPLGSMDRLTAGFLGALYEVMQFSAQDRRRRWLLAIDTHNVAYYGKRNPYLVGGPKKQGTKWFYSYATAVLLHKRRRYTIALCAVLPKTKPHQIVATLLDQISGKGLKIQGVTLDSAFDSGDTLLLLQQRGLAYSIPLRRKGESKSTNARNRCFLGRHRLVRWMEWTTDRTRLKVVTRTLLWKGRSRTMLFAFEGWSSDRARNIHERALRMRRLYKQRFGIETSYRQKNQAQGHTTSSDPVYRLLLEGIGYVLRQVWVVLTEQIARRRGLSRNAWIGDMTLSKMIDWLVRELTALHPEELSIAVHETGYV